MPRIAATELTIGVCHVAYQIAPLLQARLPATRVFQEYSTEAMRPRMPEVDVLVISGAWHDSLLEQAAKLKWIQAIGAGYDQFPLAELRRRGIRLTNAAGVNTNAVSEHAIALMLALTRRLPEARDNQHRQYWRPMISDPQAREDELAGKTLGIVGLGAIGNRLASLAKAFGMRVIGTKARPETYRGLADQVWPPDRLGDLLREADFVVLCCPLTPATRGLIGAAALKQMRPSAYLINVARGPVVDEDALIAALQAGDIAGAALDVTTTEPLPPESPLWRMANVLITPHTAGETAQYEKRLVDLIVENVHRWERDEPFLNQVV
ncbi:MAG: 3-phosphoglycerate dehydrogenase [Candidatus Tectimicrobiota bacterium]|nr:MAG: 3-phosphoglycerate dehydrogenase [Candidatus Tectomicrobia bacterium]